MQNIAIVGAGGFAREVAFLIEEINRVSFQWNLLGFVEASRERVGTPVGKYTVFCAEDELLDMDLAVVIGIGNPSVIHRVACRLQGCARLSFPNLIHPGTIWDRERISLGQGNIICAGNIFTTDIQIGSFNIFNLSCTYGHDVVVGDHCVFNPGINLSGGVKVGSDSLVGTGVKVLQYLSIGERAAVGAGAVVTKDVDAGVTVVGVPAKPLVRNS